MKTKYRIQPNNKFRLTRVRKSYLKPINDKNKSKIKIGQKKKKNFKSNKTKTMR